MARSLTFAGALVALALVLTGCTSNDAQESASPAEVSQEEFMGAYGLEGMDAVEVIDHLDRVPRSERSADLMAAVMPDHLALTSANAELSMPLPDDKFYLSIAPYVSQTHECFYHSLTTCEGELDNEDVQITVVDDSGEVLVDQDTTTFDNGFVGVWVPRDTQGTIEVRFDGKVGTTEFVATDDGATCITDLQLS